jgi:GDP-L-fucose synthase
MASNEFLLKGKKIWVAGHRGMAGSAIVRRLQSEDCTVLTVDRNEVDLRRQEAVEGWLKANRPDGVILAAGKVGGILANETYPADFIYDNLAIETNIIHGSYITGVKKLLFLGSSCIYPRMAPQPMREDSLLTGQVEPTNQWYAIAKIAGVKMCAAYHRQYNADFICAMPTNLFGAGDNYDLKGGHVVAALIMKAHKAKTEGAKTLELWGSGKPLREFLFVDDLADGIIYLFKHYSAESHINIGSGLEYSIRQLAETITNVVGWKGEFVFDATKADGPPRKLMDSSAIHALGWEAKTSLEAGLKQAYDWYLANRAA